MSNSSRGADASQRFVVHLDENLRVRWADAGAIGAAGRSFDDLAGVSCFALWHGRATPCEGCPVAVSLRTGRPAKGQVIGDGGTVWSIAASPLAGNDTAGAVVGVAEVTVDLGRALETETALRESEERYRTLVETCPDAITVTDLEGRLLMANEQGARIFGCSSVAELMASGLRATDFIVPEDRERARSYMRETLERGRVRNIEYRLLRRDGASYPAELSASLLRDGDGVPYAFVAVTRDVSERHRAAEERVRLEALVRRAQKLESLGLLAGGIAHDFNNLLVTITGNIARVLREVPAGTPARLAAERVALAGRHAAQLTGQLLDFAGHGERAHERVGLAALVEGMRSLLELSVSGAADVRVEVEPGVPEVEGDPSRLTQVVLNLVANAADAAPGGVVDVRLGSIAVAAQARPSIPAGESVAPGLWAVLEVRDQGPGMDRETVERIFDPFFSTKREGRGLGLAVVAGVVRSHGGVVDVESAPGRGSTFRVYLPALDRTAPSSVVTAAPATALDGATVLVIDDEAAVRDVVRDMLEVSGIAVLEAPDGRAGVEVFARHADAIAAVLVDASMPGMDGAETFRALRRVRPDAKVLLSSGYTLQAVTKAEGLAGFIHKPFRLGDLLLALERAVSSPPASRPMARGSALSA